MFHTFGRWGVAEESEAVSSATSLFEWGNKCPVHLQLFLIALSYLTHSPSISSMFRLIDPFDLQMHGLGILGRQFCLRGEKYVYLPDLMIANLNTKIHTILKDCFVIVCLGSPPKQ